MELTLPYHYVFVFAEPIDSTDVPVKELASLLRISDPTLLEVKTSRLDEVLQEHPPSKDVVLRALFKQSNIVSTYSPPQILRPIMKRAAYIHSCGILVCASPMEEQSVSDLRSLLELYLRSHEIGSFELSFYTHGSFATEADVLDGLLIDEKRYYLRELQFQDARRQLENWTGPGELILDKKSDVGARIWGYKDVAQGGIDGRLDWTYPEKADDIYLVVYQPLFRVKNGLYDLDRMGEAKPYWKGIDTTPQRLMGAMLNLAQVGAQQVILEPFAHTGTLVHEAVRHDVGQIIYNDKFETAGAKDNLEILTSSPQELRELITALQGILRLTDGTKTLPTYDVIRQVALDSLVWREGDDYAQIQSVEDLTASFPWLSQRVPRTFFYLVRRFFIERGIGLLRAPNGQTNPYFGGFERESTLLDALDKEIDERLGLLSKFSDTCESIGVETTIRGITYIGYGPIAKDKCRLLGQEGNIDIAKGIPLEDDTIDAVITDPPYGYGSAEDKEETYALYEAFLRETFRVLKPGGRVVICVLDKVKTGKEVDSRIKTVGVVALANKVAKRDGIAFVSDNLSPFGREPLLLSYWKAKYKLNRGILAFRIGKGY